MIARIDIIPKSEIESIRESVLEGRAYVELATHNPEETEREINKIYRTLRI